MLLAGVALVSLRPWETDTVRPHVWVSPEVGLGLDDSVAVATPQPLDVAAAHVAAGGGDPTTVNEGSPALGDVSTPVLAVSQAQPVSTPKLVPVPTRPPAGPRTPAPPPAEPVIVVSQPEPPPAAPVSLPAVLPAPPPRFVAGAGGPVDVSEVQIREGNEYALAFYFYLEETAFAGPGTDNLIVQFRSDASDARSLDLQLWENADFGAISRGLWSSGEAVGGDRFLAPLAEDVWHDAIVHFKASGEGAGFYEIYLDGQLVDARTGVSLIAPDSSYAQVELGLFRDGAPVAETSEVLIDEARLGESLESVLP